MKCPKCGYNSFEYHDICKKCSADLVVCKQTYGIAPIVFPPEIRSIKAEEFRVAKTESEQHAESMETNDDMFAFDLPEDPPAPTVVVQNDDPFNFDDDFQVTAPPPVKQPEESVFSDLLETTAHSDDDPFASAFSSASPSEAGAPAKAAAPAATPGEFDLENFSWDETPVPAATAEQTSTDDFDSLFGDMDDSTKK